MLDWLMMLLILTVLLNIAKNTRERNEGKTQYYDDDYDGGWDYDHEADPPDYDYEGPDDEPCCGE